MKRIVMKRIVRLTEADLTRLVNRVIEEQSTINEVSLENISSRLESIGNDPLLQKIVRGLIKAGTLSPFKVIDTLRALWKSTLGRPEWGGPVTNDEKAHILKLLNPFVSLTQSELDDFIKRKVEIGKKLESLIK